MPLLILLAMLMILGIISIFEGSGKRNEPLTKEELDDISMQIIGKSEKEARKIIERYQKK